jgi:hypothetical protein
MVSLVRIRVSPLLFCKPLQKNVEVEESLGVHPRFFDANLMPTR